MFGKVNYDKFLDSEGNMNLSAGFNRVFGTWPNKVRRVFNSKYPNDQLQVELANLLIKPQLLYYEENFESHKYEDEEVWHNVFMLISKKDQVFISIYNDQKCTEVILLYSNESYDEELLNDLLNTVNDSLEDIVINNRKVGYGK